MFNWTTDKLTKIEKQYLRCKDEGRLIGLAAFIGCTPAELDDKAMELFIIPRAPKYGRRLTFKAVWKTIGKNKCFFRSSWEANYAIYLQHLLETGRIKDWLHEPKTFWFNKIKRGVRSYKPDFLITNIDDTTEWHEVKGFMDSKSRTKLNRMKKYYPNEKIILIDSDAYRLIKRDNSALKGWSNN